MGKLYSLISALLLTIGLANAADPLSYEYWFDNDYSSKVSGDMVVGSNQLELDISSLPVGSHYFNIRVGYVDGSWGAVYRKMVLNLAGSVDAVAYEYWIDNNYEAKNSGTVTPDANAYEIDVQGLRRGLHRFNYRIQTGEGVWGAPFTKYFYCESNEARFTEYEYWLDNDYENRVSANALSNPVSFEVDLSAFDKSGGAHYFNLRTRDGDGDWGPVYRKLLVFSSGGTKTPLIGYRHFLNGVDLGYIEVERKIVDSYMFDIDLPDTVYPSLRNRMPVFQGDTVSIAGTDSINYTMQIRTELGWAAPNEWKFDVSNDFSTKAIPMAVNSMHTFSTPKVIEFAAVKFTSKGDTLYFRSDVPVGLDIYKDGERVERLSHASVKSMTKLLLESGDYFGLLYEVQDSLAQDFTFHIMSTPNLVPDPEISFEDGTVTISCVRSDAEIRYTLDGSEPNEESELYTESFPLKRNAIVRAIAWVPESDILPSSVVELMVDSYKVDNPTGRFDANSRLLTLTCETKDASIMYSQDFNRNDTVSAHWTAYVEPIKIQHNGSVFVKALLEGYHDSDIVEIVIDQLPNSVATPSIVFIDGMVTISCETADVEIRYTIDGTEPTSTSTIYDAPFALNRNAEVKAIAIIPDLGIDPSEVAVLVVESYKVAIPTGVFDAGTRLLTLSCATAGASISYSFDRAGDWTAYTAPIPITRNCVVYACASFDGYNDSDIAEIAVTALPEKVSAPMIAFKDGIVTISCETADAEIRYTIDGTEPTSTSTLYETPFSFNRNGVVKAIAIIPDLDIDHSEVAELVVDSYKVATPTGEFSLESRVLTLSCLTEVASIFYSFDKEGEWKPYIGPIALDGNCTVYAKATLQDFNDSDIAEIVVSDIRCAGVSFSFNGRYMQIATSEPNARIFYTTDGSEPSTGTEYYREFDVVGVCNVRAVAVKDRLLNSEIGEYSVDRYADEEHAETAAGGLLESSFEWSDSDLPQNVESFRVEGVLNDDDYKFLNSMRGLRHLDIEKVAAAGIPARAFLDSKLISISLPEEIAEYGDSILSGAQNLSSVIWNSKTQDMEEKITGGLVNPNVILYVPSGISVPNPRNLNIVIDGRAVDVKLHYGHPYYAARDFRADNVSMTREFSQQTEIGVCRGWETIVLPFKPGSIMHSVNGPAVPFAAWDGDTEGMKPFWLYSSTAGGWEEAAEIEACVPYIISMPNNPDYVESFNLAGTVTFSATDVDLGPETSFPLATPWKEGTQFEGTFMPVEEEGILSLNVNSAGDGLLPGSTFVQDGETVPFGGYVSGATGRRNMPVFGDGSGVCLPSITDEGLSIETPAPGMMRISSSRALHTTIFTPEGATVRVIDLQAGETLEVDGLTRGLYIVARVKAMVR